VQVPLGCLLCDGRAEGANDHDDLVTASELLNHARSTLQRQGPGSPLMADCLEGLARIKVGRAAHYCRSPLRMHTK
jgi:hypothetical protein